MKCKESSILKTENNDLFWKKIQQFHSDTLSFLMEPSQKNHAIELSSFLWLNARWRH